MKIIEDKWSSAQFSYPFRHTCGQCRSALEIEEGDVQEKEGKNQFEVSYSYFTVTCPLCKYVGMVTPQKK